MKKVDIGLDIGIASVGWALVESDSMQIIKHGVRLFPTMDNAKDGKLENVNRREARSARRQKNRRKTLRRDFVKFLIDSKTISDVSFNLNGELMVEDFINKYINNATMKSTFDKGQNGQGIFFLREKALTSKLNLNELIYILYWYLNHRGFKYETVEDSKDNKDLEQVDAKYSNLLPVKAQMKFIQDNGYLNGHLNRMFHHNDYSKELEEIFAHQNLEKSFTDKYFELFNRQRSFEQGPGNFDVLNKLEISKVEKILSEMKNSRFKVRDGKLIAANSMWEESIGKCSVYKEEFRAPKHSLTSELFNLLDDLNNIAVAGEKLNTNHKFDIIKIALKTNSVSNKIMSYLLKEFDLDDISEITGYKTKDDKPEFYNLGSVHLVSKALGREIKFEELFLGNKFNNDNFVDKVISVLNSSKILETRFNSLKLLDLKLSDSELKKLAQIKGDSKTSLSQMHSLSFKAMRELIPLMIIECKNQMQLIHDNNLFNNSISEFGKSKYIPKKWIDEIIDTPTVKRALRETINVLNELIYQTAKNGWKISDIVIEMARENNNKATRDQIKNKQKYFEKINSAIKQNAVGSGGNYGERLKLKLFLLEQQGCRDAYDGQVITKEELISNPGKYEVDHIIPYSLSFDDSRDNKVLTKESLNRIKSQRTSWEFISRDNGVKGINWDEMVELWKSWYINPAKEKTVFMSKNKFEYLTTKLDFNRPENQLGFIQRNLVDTRYTTRTILSALNTFKNENGLDFKVRTINGKMTSFARKCMEDEKNNKTLNRPSDVEKEVWNEKEFQKDRIWNGHHAEDAYIITVINNKYRDAKVVEKVLGDAAIKFGKFDSYKEKLEMAKITADKADLIISFDQAREELNAKMDKVLFSRKIITKTNAPLANESLYESKENTDGTIQKIVKLKLTDLNSKKCSEFFNPTDKEFIKNNEEVKYGDSIVKRNKDVLLDNNLYFELQKIYLNNQENESPFKTVLNGNKYLDITHKNKDGKDVLRRIESIRVVQQWDKSSEEVLFAPKNGSSFFDTLSWTELQIFKNKDGKFKIVPISARFVWFNKKNVETGESFTYKNSYHDYLKKYNLMDKVATLRAGDILADPANLNQKYYVVGHATKLDCLELKPVWKILTKQEYKTINTRLKNWINIETNVLGENIEFKKIF